ncbi:MAG: hemerythrin domain-containing protein [Bacteroidales bacterium]|nr:hemerythrin domain-containing protein [Bacteroidales bacterium]
MQIHRAMPMADIIHINYSLLQVITRFDIRLGFGNKTIEEVCRGQGIDVNFFLEIVNSFHDPDYFPDKELQNFRLTDIVNYLRKTHQYYLEVKIPQIGLYIQQLLDNSNPGNLESLELINRFFLDYRQEFLTHIDREENHVFSYVLEVEKAFLTKRLEKQVAEKIKNYSIDDFADEHDNIEDKLFDLKNIIIKYLPPVKDVFICINILTELFRLEKDLNNHARIEDTVLVPKVRAMEKAILGSIKRK